MSNGETPPTPDRGSPDRRKGWWQKKRLPDGTFTEKDIRPERAEATPSAPVVSTGAPSDASLAVDASTASAITTPHKALTEDTVSPDQVSERQERKDWTPAEKGLMLRGMRALQTKDKDGRRFHDVIYNVLQREGLVIDEKSFFRPHGPYSMMMPDAYQAMRDFVAEYRKSSLATDESQQEDIERVLRSIGRAESGDLSPSELEELESDIDRLKKNLESDRNAHDDDHADEAIADNATPATTAAPRAQPRMKNVQWKEKLGKVRKKDDLKKKWKHDANREWSLFTERFAVLFLHKLGWGGEGTTAKVAAETDDIFNKTDGIVRMERDFPNEAGDLERVRQIYAFDTTDAAEYGIHKVADTLRFIDLAVLTTVEFGQLSATEAGADMQGMQTLVPRINYVISRPIAAEIAVLLKNNRYDLLAVHPVQLMLLRQAQAQIEAYMSYVETEYPRDPRRRDNKIKIIDAFARLRDLFNDAATEREAVLRETMEDLMQKRSEGELSADDQDMLSMLVQGSVLWKGGPGNEHGELYDAEHGKYVRIFRPDRVSGSISTTDKRTRAWWRLTALTEKYPARRTDTSSGSATKVPIPWTDKRRGKWHGQVRRQPKLATPLEKVRGEKQDEVMPTGGDA